MANNDLMSPPEFETPVTENRPENYPASPERPTVSTAGLFSTAGGIKTQRSPASIWTAVGLHAVVIALIAFLVAKHVQISAPVPKSVLTSLSVPPPPPPIMPRAEKMGGGGGQHDLAPVTKGPMPKLA